jgi:hypothetical protein
VLARLIFVVYPTYAELLLFSRLLPVVCIVVLTLTRFIERNFLSFGEGKSVFEIMRQYRKLPDCSPGSDCGLGFLLRAATL